MGQGGQKEFFVPPCFESFATRGSLVWSHFENVCCEAAQERKISGTVILSISGEVFVEYDVLLPMTSVFDVPMLSNDIRKSNGAKRREAMNSRSSCEVLPSMVRSDTTRATVVRPLNPCSRARAGAATTRIDRRSCRP